MNTSIALAAVFYVAVAAALISRPVRDAFDRVFFFQDGKKPSDFLFLDTIRGFSALIVVLLHYYLWAAPHLNIFAEIGGFVLNGQKAVGVFYVLSSFLIWRFLRADRIGIYLVRRLLRIYPLNIALTIFLYCTFSFGAPVQPYIIEAFFLRMFVGGFPQFNGVAWSVVMEMQFYLIVPFLRLAYERHPRSIAVFLLLLLAGTYWIDIAGWDVAISGSYWSYLPWTKYFFIGTLFAIALDPLKERLQRVRLAPRALGLGFVLTGLAMIVLDFWDVQLLPFEFFRFVLKDGLIASLRILPRHSVYSYDLAIAVCVLILGLSMEKRTAHMLSFKPLRFLGVISYSLYLSQLIIIGLLQPAKFISTFQPVVFLFFIIIPMHIVISAGLFLSVESPFLRLSSRLGREPIRLPRWGLRAAVWRILGTSRW